jgi:hypothetical protein
MSYRHGAAGTAGRGIERLAREVEHDRTVLAHGIEHDRAFGLGHDFAHDVDRLGFKALEMGQRGGMVIGAAFGTRRPRRDRAI